MSSEMEGKCWWEDRQQILYGVLQGGMASPFLFSEFLYDFKDFLYKEYGAVLGENLLTYLLFYSYPPKVMCGVALGGSPLARPQQKTY